MASLALSTSVKLDITENGKVTKTFNVSFKELTRKQTKKLGKDNKAILDITQTGAGIENRISILRSKMAALEELNKSQEVVKVANILDDLMTRKEDLEEQYETLGGIDKLTEAAEASFDLQVSGKDKEALREFIEENSDYTSVLDVIRKDALEKSGK